ncbi:hypothetical protein Vadar_011349 [Vaccinium darrowii]|uniref:Uncharacterized protein n=1 Tax=Vaccinium darrowii TaxID=229202 RepID=A0ACB7YV21_9ERIC|nr:hypothetical protein Vadar_011349 [Vaccinium darrowii]
MPPNEQSEIKESPSISSEEKDHLERSTKKIKNVHTVDIYPEQERPMETEVTAAEEFQPSVVMETDSSDISQNHPPSSLSEGPHTTSISTAEIKHRSFKDAVLQSKEPSKEDLEKRLAEFLDSDEEDMDKIVSDEEMALIEAAMAAARSSLSSLSQLQKNARSIQSITLLLKRRLSMEGQPSLAGGDIENAGGGCSSRKRNRVFESLLHSFRRNKGLAITKSVQQPTIAPNAWSKASSSLSF